MTTHNAPENEIAQAETPQKKEPRKPAPKTMKMLSMAQAVNPMKHAFYGGFHNIAFQTGVVVHMPGDPPNRIYLRTDAKGKHPLPIMLPPKVRAPADGSLVKVTCTILGSSDPQGNPCPILVARLFSTPNVLEAETRRTIDLLKKDVDPSESLRKQTGVNNDVHLTGVVIGRRLQRRQREDGSLEENQSATFYLRLDADPTHVIPVLCDKKLAEQSATPVRFGSLISVRGQFQTTTIKVAKCDELGNVVKNEDGSPVYELNKDGSVKVRYHPYIFLTGYPTPAPNAHMLFTDPNVMAIPGWIETQINAEIRARSELGKQQNNSDNQRKEIIQHGDALVTKEEYTRVVSTEIDGGV